jgi:chromosome segregation ATPase
LAQGRASSQDTVGGLAAAPESPKSPNDETTEKFKEQLTQLSESQETLKKMVSKSIEDLKSYGNGSTDGGWKREAQQLNSKVDKMETVNTIFNTVKIDMIY